MGGFSTFTPHGETSEEIQIAILHGIRMLQTRRHHLRSHFPREYHKISYLQYFYIVQGMGVFRRGLNKM